MNSILVFCLLILGEVESVCYVDGDVSEWEETDIVMETDTMSLSCKYDEKYVYFRVHKDDFHFGNETLYVPIDTTSKSGSTAATGIAPLFATRSRDFE